MIFESFKFDLTSILKRIVLLFVLACTFYAGCSPIVVPFFSRTIERIGATVESVPHKISEPILPDVGLSILWVGHATVLIQIHDKVFLTDPVFTKKIGIVSTRYIEPGIDPSTLKKVDYTLISHSHIDHFSYGSLDLLPKNGTLVLPFGAAAYAPEFGFAKSLEMKPWDILEESGVRITSVPVQHFGGRYGLDFAWMQDRGFTGYVIEYKGKTVFVGGDSGYNPQYFKEIGRRFSIDVALLPIAPVTPRDFMQRVHVDPKEALMIFQDLGAKVMIPMHYRTFVQGLDPNPTYAQELLEKLINENGLKDKVLILEIGEQKVFE